VIVCPVRIARRFVRWTLPCFVVSHATVIAGTHLPPTDGPAPAWARTHACDLPWAHREPFNGCSAVTR
jgi:hypothetical protein